MGNPEWPRRKARLQASRLIELLVSDSLPIREFFDRLMDHGNHAINNALAQAYPELITTPVGSPLPSARLSFAGGSRALFIHDYGIYFSFEWKDGQVTRAELG